MKARDTRLQVGITRLPAVVLYAWLPGLVAWTQPEGATVRVAQGMTVMTLDGGVEAQRQTVGLPVQVSDPLSFTARDGSLHWVFHAPIDRIEVIGEHTADILTEEPTAGRGPGWVPCACS